MARILCISSYLFILAYLIHHTNAASCVDLGKVEGKDKYFTGRIIEILETIGFQQCLKDCERNTNCLSINYKNKELKCELLSTAAVNQTQLETRRGYVYAVKEENNVCKELHCNQVSKCFRTAVRSPVCLKKLCPRDCQNIEITKIQANQVQQICPFGNGIAIEVQCETNGKHIWTVIQKRFDGSVDFYRTWEEYKNGFGNASGEYWIGNDVLHALTATHNYELIIESKDYASRTAYEKYTGFHVADEELNFFLLLSAGDNGNDLDYNNGYEFSTKDKYSVTANQTCPDIHRSGWWHNPYGKGRCTFINPNGEYSYEEKARKENIFWYYFRRGLPLKSFLMKIRHD